MGIRLVRETSTEPNIQNKDDVRMIRYAYGGYNGYIKGYGDELKSTNTTGLFKIGSGRIVLQGWEVDIDAEGWTFDLSSATGTQYHSIYLEINVGIETATIKDSHSLLTYPIIDAGDDLTTTPNGTARLPLYHFLSNGKTVTTATKVIKEIIYLADVVDPYPQSSTIPVFKGSANAVNNVTIKKENNILKADGDIVSRKRLLWSGKVNIASTGIDNPINIFAHSQSLIGKKLQVELASVDPDFNIVSSQSFIFSCQNGGFTAVQYISDSTQTDSSTLFTFGRIIFGVNSNTLWGSSYRRTTIFNEVLDLNGNSTISMVTQDVTLLDRIVTAVYEIIE